MTIARLFFVRYILTPFLMVVLGLLLGAAMMEVQHPGSSPFTTENDSHQKGIGRGEGPSNTRTLSHFETRGPVFTPEEAAQ